LPQNGQSNTVETLGLAFFGGGFARFLLPLHDASGGHGGAGGPGARCGKGLAHMARRRVKIALLNLPRKSQFCYANCSAFIASAVSPAMLSAALSPLAFSAPMAPAPVRSSAVSMVTKEALATKLNPAIGYCEQPCLLLWRGACL
jgi:hypothetical protein